MTQNTKKDQTLEKTRVFTALKYQKIGELEWSIGTHRYVFYCKLYFKMTIMDWINMLFLSFLIERMLYTWATFLTSVNWIYVLPLASCFRKCLSTWVTLLIFFSSMNLELISCDFSSFLHRKMIFHICHNCDFFDSYDLH